MDLIQKTLKHGGVETAVYFKELTAGDQLNLARGQKFTATGEGSTYQVDMGDQLERNYKLVQLSLVDEGGKRVYASVQNLLQEKRSKLTALIKLATEAQTEFDGEGNA